MRRSSLDHFERLRIDAPESCVTSSVRRPFGHRHCEPECGAFSVFSMKGDLVDDREMFVGGYVALPQVESARQSALTILQLAAILRPPLR
jgi:hypothetical protein